MNLSISQLAFNLAAGVLGASPRGMGVWTAGCSLVKCPGCISTHTWDAANGKIRRTDDLIRFAQSQPYAPQRLTISGGEPTDQADAVADLARKFANAFPDSEIVLYTGLRWPVFAERSPALKDCVDVVVAGPYVQSLPTTALAGSNNQTLHLLTTRAEQRFSESGEWSRHRLQVTSNGNDVITVGIPKRQVLKEVADSMQADYVSWQPRSLRKIPLQEE